MDRGVLEAVCVRHLEWCEARRLAVNTVKNRRYILGRLCAWSDSIGVPVLYLKPDHLRAWQLERSRRLSSAALRAEIVNIQEFYRWCTSSAVGLLDADPSVALQKPRAQRRLPRPIGESDFRALLAAAPRDVKAILCLSGFAGLRAGEIAALTWSDVDMGSRTVRLVGKGDHERVVPLSAPVMEALSALEHRSGPVVPRLDGLPGPNRPGRISTRAAEHGLMLGVSFRLHQLRHRFATMVVETTGDIRAAQELLGHASPSTTSVYTKVRQGKLKAAVDAAAVVGSVGAAGSEGAA